MIKSRKLIFGPRSLFLGAIKDCTSTFSSTLTDRESELGAEDPLFFSQSNPKKIKESGEREKERNIKEQTNNEDLSTCITLISMTSLLFKYGH